MHEVELVVAARYDYDPYGKRLTQYESSGYTCDLGYTGHATVPSLVGGQTEIVLTNFRANGPQLAIWRSADPLGETGGISLYAHCYGNPLNFYDPDGMRPAATWWGGFFDFDQGTVDALGVGAMATADGFIPFSDPFQDSGSYNPCADGGGFSKATGGVARDAALAATIPNLGTWAKNPVMYETGSTGRTSHKRGRLEWRCLKPNAFKISSLFVAARQRYSSCTAIPFIATRHRLDPRSKPVDLSPRLPSTVALRLRDLSQSIDA